jgi:hypothetical protein
MILNIAFTAIFLAGIVWFSVRGFMYGWTVDRVVWLCISVLFLLGKVVSIRKEGRLANKNAKGVVGGK